MGARVNLFCGGLFKQVKFGGGTQYVGNDKGQMRDNGFGNMNK